MGELLDIVRKTEDSKDFSKIHDKYLVDLSQPLPKPPVAISMGHSAWGYLPFGSYGDYSCIVGQSKSRKTFFKSAVLAGYIGNQSQYYFPLIQGHDSRDKYVIDIDTEQSSYHSQRAFKRVERMVGGSIPQYRTFSLRTLETKQRREFIEWLVYESSYKDKIGLISIDGYADLIEDFNSLEQSTDLTQKLLKWSGEAHCHITGVLHLNYGSSKPVGHIGSAVLKKAETVIYVGQDDNMKGQSIVSCEYSRNIPFDEFRFEIGEDHLPKEI